MSYVYVALISAAIGFVSGKFFFKQLHEAIEELETVVAERLEAIETAILKKL